MVRSEQTIVRCHGAPCMLCIVRLMLRTASACLKLHGVLQSSANDDDLHQSWTDANFNAVGQLDDVAMKDWWHANTVLWPMRR